MFLECTGGHYSDPDLPGDHWSNCSIMSGVFPNRRVIRLRSDDAARCFWKVRSHRSTERKEPEMFRIYPKEFRRDPEGFRRSPEVFRGDGRVPG